MPFLFVACGEISEINICSNKLVLSVVPETKELINKEENKIILENILKNLGFNYIIDLKEIKVVSKEDEKIRKLKELFGNNLTIIGE